jgi:hypothetical protein
MASSASTEVKQRKLVLAVAVVGLILLTCAVLMNMRMLQNLTRADYLLFRVEGNVGYSFVRFAPTNAQEYFSSVQGLGFISIIVSLLWANRDAFSIGKKKPEFSIRNTREHSVS